MASRFNQEYVFQHSLMNAPNDDLSEIIHPNAEDIPEFIRHFASAIFVNGSYWHNSNAIMEDYVEMQQTSYNLVIKGKMIFLIICLFTFLYLYIIT